MVLPRGTLQVLIDGSQVGTAGMGKHAVIQGGVLDLGADAGGARRLDSRVAGHPAQANHCGGSRPHTAYQREESLDMTCLGFADVCERPDVSEVVEDLDLGGIGPVLVVEHRQQILALTG